MTDKEKLILGWSGGLVTLVLGYLVWRHENAVSQSQAAQQAQQDAQNNADLANQLESALSTQYPVAAGSIATSPAQSSVDTGSQIDAASTDSALEAILAAFGPNAGSTTSATATPPSPSNPATPSNPVTVRPTGGPQLPISGPAQTSYGTNYIPAYPGAGAINTKPVNSPVLPYRPGAAN